MNWREIRDGKEKYHAYLASREWAIKKEAVRLRCNGHCERCEMRPMHATHHLTYIRVFDELLSDLQGLCFPCHQFVSGKSGIDPSQNVDDLIPKMIKAMTPRRDNFQADAGTRCAGCSELGLDLVGRTNDQFYCEPCCQALEEITKNMVD